MKYLSIFLFLFFAVACNGQSKRPMDKLKPVEITGYNVGDKVEDFKLKNIDGNMVSMADYTDAEGFIVIFSCNHCPYSVAYEDRIIDLAAEYNAQNIPVIMINPNDVEQYPEDSFENMIVRAEEKEFNFPYLYDESQEVAHQFGATRTPHVFLINKEMVLHYLGAIDDSARKPTEVDNKYLRVAIESMQKGMPANPYKTKAVGCSIKWKS